MRSPIDIEISTSELFEGMNISKEVADDFVDRTIKRIALSFKDNIAKEASSTLKSTRNIYLQNLKFIDSGRMQGVVLLDYSKDKLVKMIEEGASAFDMKEGFLKSKKVKFTKDNKPYLTIPFRHAVPTSLGIGPFSGKLPTEVHKVIKSKPFEVETSTHRRTKGVTLNELPEQFQVKSSRKEIPGFGDYEHKNSIYEGVFKQQDVVTGQNRYMSFRRVSENSDPNSWIRSAMKPRNLFEKSLQSFRLEDELSKAMDDVWDEMGF